MQNLKCKTEYSFRMAYGRPEQVIDAGGFGICDRHGTWGHVQFAKAAKKKGIKPVFGVELGVVADATLREKQPVNYMSFIARNNAGLQKVYELTTLATSQMYYIPRLDYSVLYDLSDDVFVFSGTNPILGNLPNRENILIELSPMSERRLYDFAIRNSRQFIASSDNFFPRVEDEKVYQIVAGDNKESRNKPMHILTEWEWRDIFPYVAQSALEMGEYVYKECNAIMPTAEMVHYDVDKTLEEMCIIGAVKRGCDIDRPEYAARLKRELDLIKEKKFEDYFYVIADMVGYAKKHMLVGPARGSSCGSLVCYLIFITDIDPLQFNLLFERFIDITREDLPDIDIDFQDDRREMVFEYLRQKYGANRVARLGTVARYKAKSSIIDVSKELGIAPWETTDLKDAIIERSGGDARASFCILDTFESLDIGKKVLEKFPELRIAADIEGHARHCGQHAAGILVTAFPVTNYCSVDMRTGATMIDKKDAEDLNLLKIDALGLRTLAVIQDVLDNVNWTRDMLLDFPIEDQNSFEVIRHEKFAGIFQFEGFALQNICRQMPIERFDDIAVITALARPGPLTSGGTSEFIKRRTGQKEVTYIHQLTEEITKDTYGVIVYQEQVMQIARTVGKLSWEDVSSLRKAMSKSLGKEFFDGFKKRFVEGAYENGVEEQKAVAIWENINTMGSWAFNKSHAVAYGLVSYWCCVLKTRFPLEFAAACLRNSKSEEQVVQLIRELVNEGYDYAVFDKEKSKTNWAVVDGKLIGGLLNLKGCGEKMAADILERRATGKALTKRQENIMDFPITPYDSIFECREKFGHIWDNWADYDLSMEPTEIKDISDTLDGDYIFFGKLITKNLRDLNEMIFLQKRNGRRVERDTEYLNLVVEDDTGNLRCTIDTKKFLRLGKPIIEEGKIGDWYIFRGEVKKGYLQAKIKGWKKL